MSKSNKICLVLPTIRKPSLDRFLVEWRDEFLAAGINVLVVEDNPKKSFSIDAKKIGLNITHYSWEDIERDLGKDSWIIPRRSSAIRSFGYLKAVQSGAKIVITLDDDCYPIGNYSKGDVTDFIKTHVDRLNLGINGKIFASQENAWEQTVHNLRVRGLPYFQTTRNIKIKGPDVALSHGLWRNVPDLDGPTQLTSPLVSGGAVVNKIIPFGKYFPMCGMNLAFHSFVLPAMYFMLMGQDSKGNHWGYDRFDDMWAGVIYKKIADKLGYATVSGDPVIWHDRASNVFKNIQKEAAGLEANEIFWQKVDEINLKGTDFKACYKEIAVSLDMKGSYWDKLKKAMQIWADLC